MNDLDFADYIGLLESSLPRPRHSVGPTRTADGVADLGLVITAPKTECMTIHCDPQQPLEVMAFSLINHVGGLQVPRFQYDLWYSWHTEKENTCFEE